MTGLESKVILPLMSPGCSPVTAPVISSSTKVGHVSLLVPITTSSPAAEVPCAHVHGLLRICPATLLAPDNAPTVASRRTGNLCKGNKTAY